MSEYQLCSEVSLVSSRLCAGLVMLVGSEIRCDVAELAIFADPDPTFFMLWIRIRILLSVKSSIVPIYLTVQSLAFVIASEAVFCEEFKVYY